MFCPECPKSGGGHLLGRGRATLPARNRHRRGNARPRALRPRRPGSTPGAGRMAEAESLYRRALAITATAHGPEHHALAANMVTSTPSSLTPRAMGISSNCSSTGEKRFISGVRNRQAQARVDRSSAEAQPTGCRPSPPEGCWLTTRHRWPDLTGGDRVADRRGANRCCTEAGSRSRARPTLSGCRVYRGATAWSVGPRRSRGTRRSCARSRGSSMDRGENGAGGAPTIHPLLWPTTIRCCAARIVSRSSPPSSSR
jgi:hypothetical protein